MYFKTFSDHQNICNISFSLLTMGHIVLLHEMTCSFLFCFYYYCILYIVRQGNVETEVNTIFPHRRQIFSVMLQLWSAESIQSVVKMNLCFVLCLVWIISLLNANILNTDSRLLFHQILKRKHEQYSGDFFFFPITQISTFPKEGGFCSAFQPNCQFFGFLQVLSAFNSTHDFLYLKKLLSALLLYLSFKGCCSLVDRPKVSQKYFSELFCLETFLRRL